MGSERAERDAAGMGRCQAGFIEQKIMENSGTGLNQTGRLQQAGFEMIVGRIKVFIDGKMQRV